MFISATSLSVQFGKKVGARGGYECDGGGYYHTAGRMSRQPFVLISTRIYIYMISCATFVDGLVWRNFETRGGDTE